jgi:spermidine/putrescine-binding protein
MVSRIFCFGLALLATATFAQTEQRIVDAAKKEGQVSVYTSLISEDLTALSQAFEKKYGIKVTRLARAPRRYATLADRVRAPTATTPT